MYVQTEVNFASGPIGMNLSGNIVSSVSPHQQAMKRGIQSGWKIVSVNDVLVFNRGQIISEIKKCVDMPRKIVFNYNTENHTILEKNLQSEMLHSSKEVDPVIMDLINHLCKLQNVSYDTIKQQLQNHLSRVLSSAENNVLKKKMSNINLQNQKMKPFIKNEDNQLKQRKQSGDKKYQFVKVDREHKKHVEVNGEQKKQERRIITITFVPGKIGLSFKGNVVQSVSPNEQAMIKDVQAGWIVQSVGAVKVSNREDIIKEIKKHSGKSVNISFHLPQLQNRRGTITITTTTTSSSSSVPPLTIISAMPEPRRKKYENEITFKPGKIGLRFRRNIVKSVTPNSQAMKKGVQEGWKVLSVGHISVSNREEIIKEIMARVGQSVNMCFSMLLDHAQSKIIFKPGLIGLKFKNTLVQYITPNTQAMKKGIQIGWDVISVRGQKVSNSEEIIREIKRYPQRPVEIIFQHSNDFAQSKITFKPGYIGLNFKGTLVCHVTPNSQAMKKGIQNGWDVVSVNGQKVFDRNEIIREIKKFQQQPVEMIFNRPNHQKKEKVEKKYPTLSKIQEETHLKEAMLIERLKNEKLKAEKKIEELHDELEKNKTPSFKIQEYEIMLKEKNSQLIEIGKKEQSLSLQLEKLKEDHRVRKEHSLFLENLENKKLNAEKQIRELQYKLKENLIQYQKKLKEYGNMMEEKNSELNVEREAQELHSKLKENTIQYEKKIEEYEKIIHEKTLQLTKIQAEKVVIEKQVQYLQKETEQTEKIKKLEKEKSVTEKIIIGKQKNIVENFNAENQLRLMASKNMGEKEIEEAKSKEEKSLKLQNVTEEYGTIMKNFKNEILLAKQKIRQLESQESQKTEKYKEQTLQLQNVQKEKLIMEEEIQVLQKTCRKIETLQTEEKKIEEKYIELRQTSKTNGDQGNNKEGKGNGYTVFETSKSELHVKKSEKSKSKKSKSKKSKSKKSKSKKRTTSRSIKSRSMKSLSMKSYFSGDDTTNEEINENYDGIPVEARLITFQPGPLGISYLGNVIKKISPNSQAYKAGVSAGWRILKVNNQLQPNNEFEILKAIAKTKESGKRTNILFQISTTIINFKPEGLGISYTGNVIKHVVPGGQADKALVRPNWIILEVNSEPVPNDQTEIQKEIEMIKKSGETIEILFKKVMESTE